MLQTLEYAKGSMNNLKMVILQTAVCFLAITLTLSVQDARLYFAQRFVTDGENTTIVHTGFQVSLTSCVNQCFLTNGCNFVNYQSRFQICNLLECETMTSPSLEAAPMYVAANITEAKLTSDPCQHVSTNESCSVAPQNVSSCRPPKPSTEFETIGNLYNIGSRLMFRCRNDASVTYTTCLTNGSWDPSFITCCPNVPVFETGYDANGIKITFALMSLLHNNSMAAAVCKRVCARLLQINSQERFLFFQNIFNSNGSSSHYWLDGSEKFNDMWLTSSNQPLPLTSNTVVWGTSDSDGDCVRADATDDFRLNSAPCTNEYKYICEKLNL